MKLTDWYPMAVQPVRPGVYEMLKSALTTSWARWDGEKWCMLSPDFEHAKTTTRASVWVKCGYVSGWRGLAKDPNLPPSEPTHV